MKKTYLFCLFLISILLSPCFGKERGWAVQEKVENGKYLYEITNTPEQFQAYTGTLIYYRSSRTDAVWAWPVSHKAEIEKYLLKNNLEPIESKWGDKFLFLPRGFFVTKIDQNELAYIWDILSSNYAGFAEMQEKGFTQRKLMAIKDSRDFDRLFNEYIDDCHFEIRIKDYTFYKPTAHDEGTYASKDPDGLYFEKETSNAYYIRFTDCRSEEYKKNFSLAAIKAWSKDFIILDARSNSGGDKTPVISFENYLNSISYEGTVICLQDNWSYSAGELWYSFGTKDIKFNTLLVGTHSGGMQRFGNPYSHTNENLDVFMYVPTAPYDGLIPENWLGEGKGYNPQIWATTENMKEVLEAQGVKLEDVEFK